MQRFPGEVGVRLEPWDAESTVTGAECDPGRSLSLGRAVWGRGTRNQVFFCPAGPAAVKKRGRRW